MNYRCLSLTQPWASLVALGQKKIETRSWSTSYRGPLAIHAAKGLGPVGGMRGLWELCESEPFHSVIFPHMLPTALLRGAIVVVCELHSCVSTDLLVQAGGAHYLVMADQRITDGKGNFYNRRYVAEDRGMHWPLTDQERAFGDYGPGRFAWLLSDIRALPEPIPAKGALGLWTWEGDIGL